MPRARDGRQVPKGKSKGSGRTRRKGRGVPSERPASLGVDAAAGRGAGRRISGGEPLPDSWLLLTMLEVAVPLWIHELRSLHPDDRVALAHELADTVASRGDILQFRSKKPGGTADVFNATARGLAALAYQPGGVKFCGIHWEAKHAP